MEPTVPGLQGAKEQPWGEHLWLCSPAHTLHVRAGIFQIFSVLWECNVFRCLKPCRDCTWQPGRGLITALTAASNVLSSPPKLPRHGINPWLLLSCCSTSLFLIPARATRECCKVRNNQIHSSQTHFFCSTFLITPPRKNSFINITGTVIYRKQGLEKIRETTK